MIEVPGFVDLQVNGFLGVDYSDENLTEDNFISSAKELLARGTAAFLPTVITSFENIYERNLPMLAKAMKTPELENRVLGLHLEGPFISALPGAVGAHNPQAVRKPDPKFLKKLYDLSEGQIKILTIAAEADGAEELIACASELGIAVSLGHHLAKPEDIERCSAAGAKLLTHLGNGCPNQIDRHHNPIWSGLADDQLTAMIITDGHHLPPSLIKTVIRAKSTAKVIITSDASPIAGKPPGRYNTLGNVAILEPNGRLHNPEKQCLVGSSATILECVNYLASLNFLSPKELVEMAFRNPLKMIGIPENSITTSSPYLWDQKLFKFVKK
ncbi:MAG: amidohydrolase family protein [Victivallaceae bacterium]|nr:amidohydrolase family protein [Victivallaceae bacterium]MDD3117127.1 amidohydrolase family protein [Victivallaceae bacterium]MDD3704180.1 amidohydrolase family protein [Victivallaceae bacterium]MDD5664367.1 amidohydrolase family protein [Victivallaceae bacterium]